MSRWEGPSSNLLFVFLFFFISSADIQHCLASAGDVGCGVFECFENNSCEIRGLQEICLTFLHNAGKFDSQVWSEESCSALKPRKLAALAFNTLISSHLSPFDGTEPAGLAFHTETQLMFDFSPQTSVFNINSKEVPKQVQGIWTAPMLPWEYDVQFRRNKNKTKKSPTLIPQSRRQKSVPKPQWQLTSVKRTNKTKTKRFH